MKSVIILETKKRNGDVKMKKIVSLVLVCALMCTCLINVVATKNVQALDGEELKVNEWTFTHQGENTWGQTDNVGKLTKVVMSTDEVLNNWPEEANYSNTTTTEANGFTATVDGIGYDKDFDNDRFNPWSVQAAAEVVDLKPGAEMKVSFKAKASSTKYMYIAFDCDIEGASIQGDGNPIEGGLVDGPEVSNNQVIALSPEEKTYSFAFTNWVGAKKLYIKFLMGNFGSKNDYSGTDCSDIIKDVEVPSWSGDITVSNLKITQDNYSYPLPKPYEVIVKYEDENGVAIHNPQIYSGTGEFVKKEKAIDIEGYELVGNKEVEINIPADYYFANNNGGLDPTRRETVVFKYKKISDNKPVTPKATSIKKIKAQKKSLKVTLKKVKDVKGYQVSYSTSKKFKKSKTKTSSKTALTIKKLKSKKKYYLKARTYVVNDGKNVTSAWSKTKSKKTK